MSEHMGWVCPACQRVNGPSQTSCEMCSEFGTRGRDRFDPNNQRIAALESELAATKRECEGLRLQIREARECARCEHPKPTDGFAPWTDCGHCVGCQCKSALAARDATEGGGA